MEKGKSRGLTGTVSIEDVGSISLSSVDQTNRFIICGEENEMIIDADKGKIELKGDWEGNAREFVKFLENHVFGDLRKLND